MYTAPSSSNIAPASYVDAAKSQTFPKKDQAILFHSTDDSKLFDYVRSVGDIVGPKNISFASRISNNRICIYLKNVEFVDKLIQNHPIIRVGETDLPVRRLVTPAKRLIISNVCPSIPNDLIETSLKDYGLQLTSPITFLKAGIPGDEYNHILSFRRQVYIIPPSENFEMQTSLLITFDRNSHRIFLSTDKMECFLCKEKGHLAANCPNINTANELPSDNTQTGNIGNDPPEASNIQTEQTPESPQPGQKRELTESVDGSGSPEPHSSKPVNEETPLMPPPAQEAVLETPKHIRKKSKKGPSDASKISEASKKTIRDLYSNDPSNFSIPVNNLLGPVVDDTGER